MKNVNIENDLLEAANYFDNEVVAKKKNLANRIREKMTETFEEGEEHGPCGMPFISNMNFQEEDISYDPSATDGICGDCLSAGTYGEFFSDNDR